MSSVVRVLRSRKPSLPEKHSQLPEQASDDEPADQPGWAFSRKTARKGSIGGRTAARNASKTKRRHSYHPCTSSAVYSSEEARLLKAVADHRSATGKPFISVTDTMKIAERLGWHLPGSCACHHDTAIDVG
jgi:hypothetical protein